MFCFHAISERKISEFFPSLNACAFRTGPIPTTLGNLTALTLLDLAKNGLEGDDTTSVSQYDVSFEPSPGTPSNRFCGARRYGSVTPRSTVVDVKMHSQHNLTSPLQQSTHDGLRSFAQQTLFFRLNLADDLVVGRCEACLATTISQVRAKFGYSANCAGKSLV